jgi:hypothetical protein
MRDAVPEDQPEQFWAGDYEHRAAESLVRLAERVTRLGDQPGDLVAEAFGNRVQVAVRYRPADAPLTGTDVHDVAMGVRWETVIGLIVLSNTPFEDAARRGTADFVGASHRRANAMVDGRDDGTLKRLLVQIAG